MTAAVEITAESASRVVRTKPFRIHYYEAGSGHPVVLLHGSGPGATGWSNFYPNIAALAENFHVYAVDMPGWGESDTQTDETGRDAHPRQAGRVRLIGIACTRTSHLPFRSVVANVIWRSTVARLWESGKACAGRGCAVVVVC